MSGWQLDIAGIAPVLLAVNAEASTMYETLAGIDPQAVADGVGWAPDLTAAVTDAVTAMMTNQESRMATIGNHIDAGQLGVLNATTVYRQGDEEMAATIQTTALDAADSGDFTWFDENGVS